MRTLQLLLAVCLSSMIWSCSPETQTPEKVDYLSERVADKEARMEWWKDARFGMFIHWGPYAVPAGIHNGEEVEGIGEWIMDKGHIPIKEYEAYSRAFNPQQYDADAWVALAKEAGMKYIVITSKHHDGFCLWDSEITEYDIVDYTEYKQDLLAPLAAACKKYGVELCFYHSIMDWHHPDAQAPNEPNYNVWRNDTVHVPNPNFPNYLENYMKPQLKELVEKYDPAIFWFDGEWIPEFTHEQGQALYQYVRELKPSIIVNNRVDKGRNGMQGMNREGAFAGDFGTPEQEILEARSTLDWEACMTMNDTWGFKKNDDNWKSSEMLIHNLIDIVAKGGNYLLNVGPTAEGLIPGPSVERLEAMGRWLAVNGEAIYKSESIERYKEGEQIRFIDSKEGDHRYAIFMEWPGQSLTFNSNPPEEGSELYILGYEPALSWEKGEGDTWTVSLPSDLQDPKNRPCSFAWVLKTEKS